MHISLKYRLIFTFIALLVLGNISAYTQGTEKPLRARDFYGYWEIKEPAGDTCYVLVKRNKTATCFWSGQGYNELEKGTWTFNEKQFIITWENNYRYVLIKTAKDEIERIVYAPQSSIEKNEIESRALGSKFKRKVVGSLAIKDSDKKEEPKEVSKNSVIIENSEITEKVDSIFVNETKKLSPMLNPFVGYWEVASSGSLWGLMNKDRFFIHIDRGGRVNMALKEWDDELVGQKGQWTLHDNVVFIEWPSGHKAIIQYAADKSIQFATISKNDDFNDSPNKRYVMRRANPQDTRLLFSAGNTALISIEDIIGCWLASEDTDISAYLAIERWGIARRIKSEEVVNGSWTLNGFDVEIKWEDGDESIISVSGQRSFSLVHYYKDEEGINKSREISIIRFKTEKEMQKAYEDLLQKQRALR